MLEYSGFNHSLSLVLLSYQAGSFQLVHGNNLIAGKTPPVDATFDPEKWGKANKQERGKYLGDIISRQIPIGKTKTELTTLLGKPDTGSRISYDLGMFLGEMDGYTLDLLYNQDGKILSGDILQH